MMLKKALPLMACFSHFETAPYRDCAEITDDMIRAFVEKIVIHKTVRSADGQKTRQIEVHLSFIGQFVLPPEAREPGDEQ